MLPTHFKGLWVTGYYDLTTNQKQALLKQKAADQSKVTHNPLKLLKNEKTDIKLAVISKLL